MTLKDQQLSQAPDGRSAEQGEKPPSPEAQLHLYIVVLV